MHIRKVGNRTSESSVTLLIAVAVLLQIVFITLALEAHLSQAWSKAAFFIGLVFIGSAASFYLYSRTFVESEEGEGY